MSDSDLVERCLLETQNEAREIYCNDFVRIIDSAPTSFEFYKYWVSRSVPFILKGGVSHWPAVGKWSTQYFRKAFPDRNVTVTVTPNGYADAVVDDKFVLPAEREMAFTKFLDIVEGKTDSTDVFYIQKQNSNLVTDFPNLLSDIVEMPWATEALGSKPDAVNFWMGQERAITSLHKDFYENLYAVIAGEKTFTLHPPWDRPFIPYKTYNQGRFTYQEGRWDILDCKDSTPIPWIAVDPLKPDYEKYPMYRNTKPVVCTLTSGDLLYLPSLWFHHVTQQDATIAVNFWYDMEFDVKYGFYQTLNRLSNDVLNR